MVVIKKTDRFIPQSLIDDLNAAGKKVESGRPPAEDIEISDVISKDVQIDIDSLDIIAIRRTKTRELRDMGYNRNEIHKILSAGITLRGTRKKFKGYTVSVVDDDLNYIRTEDLNVDLDFFEKKAELISKYNFIYKRAIGYAIDKNQISSKAALFNVAKSVLDKLAEIEGVTSPDKIDMRLTMNQGPAKIAEDLNKQLTQEDKDEINSTINEILAKRQLGGTEGLSIPTESPTLRTQTSDDEGVSGQSEVHVEVGPAEGEQQENTD